MSRRQVFYHFTAFAVLCIMGSFHNVTKDNDPIRIEGATMGTTYHVTYFDQRQRNLKVSIDSLLIRVNAAISNYDPASDVSVFNRSIRGSRYKSVFFRELVTKAVEISSVTNGYFDPTVMPLVNAWGFGPGRSMKLTDRVIDSLLQFVGYKKITLKNDSITKTDPRVQLDFGGIGQGYGADVIAVLLRSRGITNFLVEIGGEGVASGRNLKKDSAWTIGILDPASTQDNQFYKAFVRLTNRAFTTAGNYFNYRMIDGRMYGHTINPKAGRPVQHELLSVSIFADDCTTADAWDTALLAAGFERARTMLANSGHEGLLIYSTPEGKIRTYSTPGIAPFIEFEQN